MATVSRLPLQARVLKDSVQDAAKLQVPGAEDLADLSSAVLALYQGLDEPRRWQKALDVLASYLDVAGVTLVVRPSTPDDPGFMLGSTNADAMGQPAHVGEAIRKEISARYTSYYYQIDPFRELPEERVVVADEYVGEFEWLSSRFYRELLEPARIRHMIGVNMLTRAGTVCRFRASRWRDRPPFSEKDKTRLALLVPHLKQAITLAYQLDGNETERELYEGALDRLNIATIVLDETGRVHRVNGVANKLLNGGDGLRIRNRKVEALLEAETDKLHELIEETQSDAGHRVHAMSVSRTRSDHRLGVVIRGVPLREHSEGKGRPATVMFVRDPDAAAEAPREILRRLFGFTLAEALLATELANGHSLDEAAEALGIRRNTARAQLRGIFVKAGVGRQSELVRLLLNGVLGLSR